MTALKRSTTTDDVRQRLADEILLGQFLPGHRLDEQSLSVRYGVSRTPVREALKQLAVTGLVEARPHKGVVVAEISAEALGLMFEAIADCEAACARHAARRMTPTDRQMLADLHSLSHQAVVAGDGERYDALNREFHALILRGARNSYLADAAQALRNRVMPFRRAQFRRPERIGQSYAEHQQIVDAILTLDEEAAARAMRRHVAEAGGASADLLVPVRRVQSVGE
jgi:DNA-binding GntR family transcriptional regulator